MKHKHPDDNSFASKHADTTHEVTGSDAPRDDAETGSAGNGASAYGGDLTGVDPEERADYETYEEEYKLEHDPSHPEDIVPDKVEKGFEEPGAEDREYSARPEEELRPITSDLLPTEDPDAQEE